MRFVNWPDNIMELLGVYTDVSIAKHVGCSAQAVARLRRSGDIPVGTIKMGKELSAEAKAALTTDAPTRRLAATLGVQYHVVAKARKQMGVAPGKRGRPRTVWPAYWLNALEYTSDAEVAVALNIHPETVKRKRRELGLPPFKRAATEYADALLDEALSLPDKEAAAMLGCSEGKVRYLKTRGRRLADEIPI